MKSLFYKKIKCVHCGGNFKRRKNRKKYAWLCSRRENGYSNCPRVVIDEEYLIEVIEKRIQTDLTPEIVNDIVEQIEVEDTLLFTIHFTNQEPIIFSRNHIVF